MITLAIIIFVIFIYLEYHPSLDITEAQIILWYDDNDKRNFKILWTKDE